MTDSTGSPPLRVGISTNTPPLAFKEGGKVQGLEVDFALQLARFLNRNIQFKELNWDDQFPALEAGKIDVIMSGMTITQERSYRVTFSKPYLRSGQMLLVKTQKTGLYANGIYSLMGTRPAMGTIKGTTTECPPTGSECKIAIVLNGDHSCLIIDKLSGVVKRCDERSVAVEFDDRLEWIALVPIYFHKSQEQLVD